MSPERIERALSEVAREARTAPLPDVDWAAIEEQLPMTRVHTVPPRSFNVRPWLIAAAFAIGAGALGLHLQKPANVSVARVTAAPPSAPVAAPNTTKDVNGDALAPGAHIVAGDLAQTVIHAGHARWTLAPHSEATLLANGDIVTIRLDRGSVTSRVTKSSRTETFAVEAADVRVAAHGTEFVVSLGADGVSVSVTEGSVLVGPREEPGTGQLLISPSARRYTLVAQPLDDSDDGLAALGAHPSRSRPSTVEETATNGATSAPAASGAHLALDASTKKPTTKKTATPTAADAPAEEEDQRPTDPTPEGLERATAGVMRLTQVCFKERTIAGEGVRVTAQTSITFRTLPQGGVNRVVFEPPLSPAVQACVNAGMSAIQTEATRNGFQVSRTVDLER
jgi:hypothetical protein